MNVSTFKHCPYCGEALSTNTCKMCWRTLYSSPHPNVSLLIFDRSARQVLLVKESKPDRAIQPNWELPGGFVDLLSSKNGFDGESLEGALQREMEEELGYENMLAVMRNASYLTSLGDSYADGTPIVVVYFIVEIEERELNQSSNPSVQMRWFDIGDLSFLEWPSDRKAVHYFLEHRL